MSTGVVQSLSIVLMLSAIAIPTSCARAHKSIPPEALISVSPSIVSPAGSFASMSFVSLRGPVQLVDGNIADTGFLLGDIGHLTEVRNLIRGKDNDDLTPKSRGRQSIKEFGKCSADDSLGARCGVDDDCPGTFWHRISQDSQQRAKAERRFHNGDGMASFRQRDCSLTSVIGSSGELWNNIVSLERESPCKKRGSDDADSREDTGSNVILGEARGD